MFLDYIKENNLLTQKLECKEIQLSEDEKQQILKKFRID